MYFIKKFNSKGVHEVVCTDIDRDGGLKGPSIKLYQEILNQLEIDLVASGGVSGIRDLDELKRIGCDGVIVGKAIYEKRISLEELSERC